MRLTAEPESLAAEHAKPSVREFGARRQDAQWNHGPNPAHGPPPHRDADICQRHQPQGRQVSTRSEGDPGVLSLEPSESSTVAASKGIRHLRRPCEPHGPRLSIGLPDELGVGGDSAVQLMEELLIRDVALALRRDSAEHPHGDGQWECQEQQARGEPQPTVGYFVLPLWPSPPWLPLVPLLPFPPPWSAGGPPPLAFGGAAGAFLACPGGSPW